MTLEKPAGEGPLSDDDYAVFLKQIDVLPELIINEIGITDFTRQGYRAVYLFPMDALEPSETWLLSLGAYSFSEPLVSAFGGKVEATSATITIYGSSARYRIAFEGVERLAQVDFGQGFLNVQARDNAQRPAGVSPNANGHQEKDATKSGVCGASRH